MTRRVAIVAAHAESERIAATVAALRTFVDEVVVVDDGSPDGTDVAARTAGARVVRCERRLGKGGAMARGVAVAGCPDVVLFADADLGPSAANLAALLVPILGGATDLAVAVPGPANGGGFGLVRRLAALAVRLAGGSPLRAPLSGQRAVSGAALGSLLPFAPRFGVETGMLMDAARAGLRVVELPIGFTHRATGRGPAGFLHRARQGVDVLAAAIPRLRPRRP